MKKIALLLSSVMVLLLAGCFEITDEISIREDGSGTLSSTTDMSMLLSMAKSMAGSSLPKDDNATDTTISLAKIADSLGTLSPEEAALLSKGTLGLKISLAEEKMLTRIDVPFARTSQISQIKALSSRITNYFMSKNAGEGMPADLGDKMISADPTGDYFITTFSKGLIEKKLNKEKYAGVDNDEMMKGIKEMSENGMPVTSTIILNLPSPATKTEGKGIVLSEDKKKVTIKTSSEDFFDNAAGLEFRIEY